MPTMSLSTELIYGEDMPLGVHPLYAGVYEDPSGEFAYCGRMTVTVTGRKALVLRAIGRINDQWTLIGDIYALCRARWRFLTHWRTTICRFENRFLDLYRRSTWRQRHLDRSRD